MGKEEIFRAGLEQVLAAKFQQKHLTGWFRRQEIGMEVREEFRREGREPDAAELLCACAERLPLSIPRGSAIAGTQDDAFSPSYALINPAFRVETFAGYCDPVAIYDDMQPDAEFPAERIERVRNYYANTPYTRKLKEVYAQTGGLTEEVAFFVEPVTGHTIPDLRPVLAHGIDGLAGAKPFRRALDAAKILAKRYAGLADKLIAERSGDAAEVERLKLIAANCRRVPANGAANLHEAVQCCALLWMAMCLEQAPNPYAFSVGNLDRILEPYRKNCPRDEAAALVRHFLAFLMVGDRCWAISQNVMVGGRDAAGNDLTCPMTYAVLDAFRESNNPQPALSVKLHRNTPPELYAALGSFFFTPGHSTPSLFNDDMLFPVLRAKGIAEADLADYAIAGCQEPLIMGKESGNTTNSWLNLAKVLELTLHDGRSALTGRKLGLSYRELGYENAATVLADLETAFFRQLDHLLPEMAKAANDCTALLATQPVPFTSALMGSLESGRDMRDAKHPGVRYHASGCLVHGLSVVADSLTAVKHYLAAKIGTADELLAALSNDFAGGDALRAFLAAQPKYGNNLEEPDAAAARINAEVCRRIGNLRNPAGNPFLPDFSTPSTHLLYGHHVGATPDGRNARQMLGYGIDPRPEAGTTGRLNRMLSQRKLDYRLFRGGYASHIGLSPEVFQNAADTGAKMAEMTARIIKPLFRYGDPAPENAPFYVYFNIDSATGLRKVLANPEKYAPNGIYIMRIHGTFVNFLDLSPAIQNDIIARLDPEAA